MVQLCYGKRRTAYHARHKVFSDSYENTPAVTKNNASVVTETLDAADTSVARDVARNADLPSGSSVSLDLSDTDELYRKYLKHLGDVKSEGGVLKGDIDTGYRVLDHRNVSDEAIKRLSNEVGDGSTEAIEQTVKALDKNQTFVDEQIIKGMEERAHRSR